MHFHGRVRPIATAALVVALRLPAQGLPLEENRPSEDGARFAVRAAATTGISLRHEGVPPEDPRAGLVQAGLGCGGIAVGDFDGDGRPDLYLVSGPGANRLYLQRGPRLTFADVTDKSLGLDGGKRWGVGAAVGDLDNDGDLDLVVANYAGPNQLFLNLGPDPETGIRFAEAGVPSGLGVVDASVMPVLADYDSDGDLDVFLLTQAVARPGMAGRVEPRSDRLFRNEGLGLGLHPTFTEATQEVGLGGVHGTGRSAVWWDYDFDGDPDLYVSNGEGAPSRLWRNEGKEGFSDVGPMLLPGVPLSGKGVALGDLDQDGFPDLLAPGRLGRAHAERAMTEVPGPLWRAGALTSPPQYARGMLFLGTGGGRFREAAYLEGLATTGDAWSVVAADFDNDGAEDAHFLCGTPGVARSGVDHSSLMFRGGTVVGFEEVGAKWGTQTRGIGQTAAVADLDGDGDLDLIQSALGEEVAVLENLGGGRSVVFDLRVRTSSQEGLPALGLSPARREPSAKRAALGSRVEIRLRSGRRLLRFLSPQQGYLASHEPLVHVGLGQTDEIEEVVVHWPGGVRETVGPRAANQRHLLIQSLTAEVTSVDAEPAGLLAPSEHFAALHPRETVRNDFVRQPLKPRSHAQLGPGMAWGDFDGDGDPDLYLGGVAGRPGELRRNDGGGKFTGVWNDAIAADLACEDMGTLLVDFNGDRILDLFVASGSSEFPEGAPELEDRLYLGTGGGGFRRAAAGVIPAGNHASGPVAAADYDKDGDLDLFVGGRIVRGSYPSPARSRLLENVGTVEEPRFRDATPDDLKDVGMVSGAAWADLHGDGWPELILALECGPITAFRNSEGTLESMKISTEAGFWSGVLAEDLDGDGDIDIAATNLGWATPWGRPSMDRPAFIHHGDWEGNEVILAVVQEGGKQVPLLARSRLIEAIPALEETFPTPEAYAKATAGDVFGEAFLKDSGRVEISRLGSGVYFNEGDDGFRFVPFPREAQMAPAFGIGCVDLDLDGHLDLVLSQNSRLPVHAAGGENGGIGTVLLGGRAGGFIPMPVAESAFVVPGEGRATAIVDLNDDSYADVVVAQKGAAPATFVQRPGRPPRPVLRVRLDAPSNLIAGARIGVEDQLPWSHLRFGGGYLTQNPAEVFLAHPGAEATVVVKWPDGEASYAPAGRGSLLQFNR